MKKILWYLIIIYSINVLSYAQEKKDSITTNSLIEGSWSIQFGIQSNFTLKDFRGSNISFKKHITSNSAWRMGITLNGQIEDMDGDLEGDQSSDGLVKGNYDRLNIAINCQYLYYPHPLKNINLFFGIGPFIGFSNFYSKEIMNHLRQDTLYYIDSYDLESKGISIGFLLIAGIEYFITKYISLHAEYSSSASYSKTWDKDRRRYDFTDVTRDDSYINKKDNRSRLILNSNLVLFGLSAYF